MTVRSAAVADALPTASAADARARLRWLLAHRWHRLLGVLTLTAGATAAQLAGPLLIAWVIDAVSTPDARRVIDRAALAFLACVVVGAVLSYSAAVVAARLAEEALNELRQEVFDHALTLPVDVVERVGTGELVSRVTGDVQTLTEFTRRALPQLLFAGAEAVLTIVALVLVDVRLAAVSVLAVAPVTWVAARWYFTSAPARYRLERERAADLMVRLHEGYTGAVTLRAYRATDRFRSQIVDAGGEVVDANMATTSARNRLRASLQLAQGGALLAVLVVGAFLFRDDRVSIGAVTAAAIYLVALLVPVGAVLEQVDLLQRSTASLARIVGVTQVPTDYRRSLAADAADRGGARRSSDCTAGDIAVAVEISGVSFGYNPAEPVLSDIDLTVRRGERLAIVGASGAGKTTLAKLLIRARHADVGTIRLNGVAIEELEPELLPRVVALVVQEPHTFARTVFDNVALANPQLDRGRVQAALAGAGAGSWVDDLPDGIDTLVGDGHVVLSPPQQQQLALARLLAADPDIVILDEATADLDPIAAASTEHHLRQVLAGRTIITIAHRLEAAMEADRVAIMDAGRVVAVDTHQHLLANEVAYRHLWDTRAGTSES